ncbi:MAG: TatD family hydrolase, partial [Acidimicrobiia bacterium]
TWIDSPTWIDSHCHIQEPPEERGAVIGRAVERGVGRMVCVGTDLAASQAALGVARAFPEVSATVGLHPHDASRLASEWPGLVALADEPEVVGIGEAGFDLHYRYSPELAQEEAFRAQVRLAHQLSLPLVVHTRLAWDQTFRVLEDEAPPRCVVFHCFTGGPEEARRAASLDAYVSFSGIISFPSASDLREAAAAVAPHRLLVETDSPYLAPVPHRGRPNEPALVPVVGAALAAATGRSVEDIARITSENALRVFWPDSPPTASPPTAQ